MKPNLKPLSDQVMVITGASSGIGLATARMAAERGAKVVLAARSEGALHQLAEEIRGKGGRAHVVVADVARPEDLTRIADEARATFGGFDTWVNNAGIGMYGRLDEISVDDMRRLFDTNVWGLVHGSLEAIRHLKQHGGALINVGSEVSERAVPLQGAYSASKHAVKGFTDALRMELEDEDAPVSVTLIKPGQIDTPFTVNAKNYLDSEPHHVPPVYAAGAVAEAILTAAVKPVRDVFVGGGAKAVAEMAHLAPGLTDKGMNASVIPGTPSGKPSRRERDRSGLDVPTEALEERGNYEGRVMETSLYTKAALNPLLTGAFVAGAGLLLGAIVKGLPHRPAAMRGDAGRTTPKALHIHLEAKPGREAEVEDLLRDILACVVREPATSPWYGVRLSHSTFGIFEAFPDEAGREAHLTGEGAAILMKRSNALLAEPARIDKLDVLMSKQD
ncbi:SDR family oxidoreductase [Methylobacterium sp. E-041]|nr:SDR family oxidoreductase [Methylobacterium sp. E-041]MCJ2107028.1 SDR family oxidoreductase [Methylobacterium sp. E-041]